MSLPAQTEEGETRLLSMEDVGGHDVAQQRKGRSVFIANGSARRLVNLQCFELPEVVNLTGTEEPEETLLMQLWFCDRQH